MYDQIERELKILITKEIYEKMRNSYEFSDAWAQTNTYYDTKDGQVKKRHGALRIRKIGNKHILTLKIRKDAITHIELEKEINVDSIQAITDSEILAWLKEYEIPKEVEAIVSFTTIRQTYDLENGQLCLDQTEYENHIDYECEYEYTKDHDGIKVFNEILKPYGMTYTKNCPSKIARAL